MEDEFIEKVLFQSICNLKEFSDNFSLAHLALNLENIYLTEDNNIKLGLPYWLKPSQNKLFLPPQMANFGNYMQLNIDEALNIDRFSIGIVGLYLIYPKL